MHDLRLVGVHEDGEHLVLSGADGEQFLLRVDEPLRAAVRRDRAHLGQLQIEMSGELRPRDVQAQIRGGSDAEDVAARTGWPLERVRRYEGPVLAERAHIADLGRGVTLRRRGSDPAATTLGGRVEQRLSGRGVDTSTVEWDSWRSDDGPWMLTLRFTAGGRDRLARWSFDVSTRTVAPQDDEALWLSEDERPASASMGSAAAPHLSAVPTMSAEPARGDDRVYDLDAEGGLGQESSDTVHLTTSAVDLVGAMRQRRHGRRRQDEPTLVDPQGTPSPVDADTLEVSTGSDASTTARPVAHPFPFAEGLRSASTPKAPKAPTGPVADEPVEPPVPPSGASRPRNFGPPPRSVALPDSGTPSVVGSRDEPSAPRRGRRASVPSWEEIMFGGKRE